jgi:hypothetical protein
LRFWLGILSFAKAAAGRKSTEFVVPPAKFYPSAAYF